MGVYGSILYAQMERIGPIEIAAEIGGLKKSGPKQEQPLEIEVENMAENPACVSNTAWSLDIR